MFGLEELARPKKDGDRPGGLSRPPGLSISRRGAALVRLLAQKHRHRYNQRAAYPLFHAAHRRVEELERLAPAGGPLDNILSAQGPHSERTRALARRGLGLFR